MTIASVNGCLCILFCSFIFADLSTLCWARIQVLSVPYSEEPCILVRCAIGSLQLLKVSTVWECFFFHRCRANNLPFWLGQILPFTVMNIFNWSLFITIIISVCLKRRTATDEQGKKAKELNKSHMTMTIGLANLCGLGWIFGLAASSMPVMELTFISQLLFSIFVGSQGILLFFFHCIRNPQARNQWKTWFTNARRMYSVITPSTLKSDSSKSDSTKSSVQVSSLSHNIASIGNSEGEFHLKSHKNIRHQSKVYSSHTLPRSDHIGPTSIGK